MYWNNSRYYGHSLLRHCGHFMWSPTNFFIVLLSLQRTPRTYSSAHNMKVSGFLIYTVTYFTVFNIFISEVLWSFRASSFLLSKMTNRKIFKIVPLFSRFIRTICEFFNVFCCFNVLAILALSSSLCRTRYSFLFGSQGLSSHITAHNKFIKSCQISLFTIQFIKNVTLPSRWRKEKAFDTDLYRYILGCNEKYFNGFFTCILTLHSLMSILSPNYYLI